MDHAQLLVFAKYPEPGSVMTRLCPPLSAERAACIQRACIRLLCERAFRCWPVRPLLMISPDDSEDRFREVVGPFVRMRGQGEGDLGTRLERAIGRAIDEGERSVVVIGSDSPTMPDALIRGAVEGLAECDAVVGPCADGGFYLIAVRRYHEGMLDGVTWSGDRAAEQVVRRLERLGWRVGMLDEWYDIDRMDDLARAARDLREQDRRDDFELRRAIEAGLDEAKRGLAGGVGPGGGGKAAGAGGSARGATGEASNGTKKAGGGSRQGGGKKVTRSGKKKKKAKAKGAKAKV